MGHEHVQRFGNDRDAFNAMRDRRPGRSSFLLDTYDTLTSGMVAAFEIIAEQPDAGHSVRYDSGDKITQYLCLVERAKTLGLNPVHILEDGFDAELTRKFEELRTIVEVDAMRQFYGYGGYIVARTMPGSLTRDRVSAVYKLTESGGKPTMKFGNESGRGKQSVPGRPVVFRRTGADGPISIIGQQGERPPHGYSLLTGNKDNGGVIATQVALNEAAEVGIQRSNTRADHTDPAKRGEGVIMPVLKPTALIENRVAAIRLFQRNANITRAQIDVSGGVDSAVMAALLVRALGADNVTAVFSNIDSSANASNRAWALSDALGLNLIVDDLSIEFRNRVSQMLRNLIAAGYDADEVQARVAEDPTVLGSFRSTLRAPLGRAYNRMTGGGLRYGTGNECEDRWLRFYQKGGDGEVDCNPLAMLSKGEVFQLALALDVPRAIRAAIPSPDLWASGETHNDEDELHALTGVAWTYSRVDPDDGRYLRVGTIERMSRWLDTVNDALFDERRSVDELMSGRWFGPPESHPSFDGYSYKGVRALLESARDVERATRHKLNPNCPTLGTRTEMVTKGLLTNALPVLQKEAA